MKTAAAIVVAILCICGAAFIATAWSAFGNRRDGRTAWRAWALGSVLAVLVVAWLAGGWA